MTEALISGKPKPPDGGGFISGIAVIPDLPSIQPVAEPAAVLHSEPAAPPLSEGDWIVLRRYSAPYDGKPIHNPAECPNCRG
jgi:hypothetical protein